MRVFNLPLGGVLTSTLLFITAVSATPLVERSKPISTTAKAPKRQTPPFAVTGVMGSGIQTRLEIRDLVANTDQFNIFLLGLQRMQAMDQNNFLSSYQISGIHGRPLADWNGVQGDPSSQAPGYCTHTSNLFLTWHRPYLALYEEILVSNALDAANSFPAGPIRDKYVAAARTLRLPYWDWSKTPISGEVVPAQLTTPTISVTLPNASNTTTTINNPLYSYRFHPTDANGQPLNYNSGLYYTIEQFNTWMNTLRWPTDLTTSATSNSTQLSASMKANQFSFRNRLYNLLSQFPNYMDFTNEPFVKTSGTAQSYDSLESLHDSIHNMIGGTNYGHMSVIDVSAFDPIFWLHHCMIDRIFAIWQALSPDSYVQPQRQFSSSYWYKAGDVLDANTELLPFHSNVSGGFWTSAMVRDHTKFFYTYPELQASTTLSNLRRKVNDLYGPSASGNMKRDLADNYTSPLVRDTMLHTRDAVPTREYNVNIRAPKNYLRGSYSVFVFMGDPSDDPDTWPYDDNLVGTYGVMSSLSAQTDMLVAGTIPLTQKLQELQQFGIVSSLDDSVIEPYLTKELHWRIRKYDGQIFAPASIPDLAISVVSMDIIPAVDADSFPTWSTLKVHTAVTIDKAGGVNTSAEV